MKSRRKDSETAETPAGAQRVIIGVTPITQRDRLAFKAAAPLEPCAARSSASPSHRCDHGLFDMELRRQTDLVDELRRLRRNEDLPPPITNKGE